jgi:hypothetical protein
MGQFSRALKAVRLRHLSLTRLAAGATQPARASTRPPRTWQARCSPAPLSLRLLDLTAARCHERGKLGPVPQLTGSIALHPLHGLRELHGVEQPGGSSSAFDPPGELGFEPAASLFICSPPIDPRSERRPSRNERLVRQIRQRAVVRLGAVDGDQAMLDKLLQHRNTRSNSASSSATDWSA